jgi:hypothetical protein
MSLFLTKVLAFFPHLPESNTKKITHFSYLLKCYQQDLALNGCIIVGNSCRTQENIITVV